MHLKKLRVLLSSYPHGSRTISGRRDLAAPAAQEQGWVSLVDALKIFLFLLVLAIITQEAAAAGGFLPTGSMSAQRARHSATLLPNGMVLVAGGYMQGLGCDLYDPSTGTFTAGGNLVVRRWYHTATLLTNGDVLITGGSSGGYGPSDTSAELYDPTTGTFTLAGWMSSPRAQHTATLLPNGKVLVVGGLVFDPYGVIVGTAELYDPATGVFTLTGSLTTPRCGHTASLLANGQVLIAGGGSGYNSAGGILVVSSAELYDPATGTFSPTGSTGVGHVFHTATLLGSGKVLVAGGTDATIAGLYDTAELYDPATGTFTATGNLTSGRSFHTATLLPNGSVLLAGGVYGGSWRASTELYRPATGTFSQFNDMNALRYGHTATLLQNGAVLLAGGWSTATAELLPPNAPPVANAGPNQTVSVNYPCQASVTLDGTGSSDPDGDPLAYTWTGDFGTATGATPTVTLSAGTHVITLTVDDGRGGTASATVTVTVTVTINAKSGTGGFVMTGSMSDVRWSHSATLLPDGKVLVAGGFRGWRLASAEIYDPCTGAFTPTGNLNRARMDHTATLLPDGQVLIAGGMVELTGADDTSSMAELYDPGTATFSVTGNMNSPRARFTATLLGDGKILLVGGVAPSGIWPWDRYLASAELYDPATGAFTLRRSLITARADHTATLLPDGRVLIAGGINSSGNPEASAELYDPFTGAFLSTGSMSCPRFGHTATLLGNGEVLVAGLYAAADIYDPRTGTFSFAGSLNTARYYHTATLLPDGSVLLTGGNSSYGIGILATAERYDSVTRTFFQSDSLNSTRELHTATLMPNGAVLIAGGYNGEFFSTAELWESGSPPVANAGPNQTVSADGACQASVTLNGTGSTDPNGSPLVYVWTGDFGTATGATPTITLSPGGHPITLIVANASGATASATVTITVTATPTITSLDPGAIYAAGPDFILTVNGCGFANGTTVQWNGAARPTVFVNSSQLTAAISAADIASTPEFYTTATVRVVNPDGTVSNPATFTIYNPNVITAQELNVGAGQTGIWLSDGNEHGFTGYVNDPDAAPLAVTLAIYSQNPVPGPSPDVGAGYSALLFSGASSADSASVVFDFPADNLGFINPYTPGLRLLFFNGSYWTPVLSSGGVPPQLLVDLNDSWYDSYYAGLDGNGSGNLTVVFDNTSTPKITDLNHATYFALGITPSLNLNFQNFSNGAVGLGSGAIGSGGSAGVGNTFWFDNFQVGAPGVPPELIATLDYSDSFPLTPTRTDGLVYDGNSSGAFNVENSYGNLPAAWTPASGIFTFKTPATSTDPAALGAATGDPGAGPGLAESTDIDFNFAYGLRSDYVVQVDAILPSDRLDISSVPAAGDSPLWYIGQYAPGTLSVFFRRDSAVGGWAFPLAPRGVSGIGIYNGIWEIGLYDASGNPITTGVNDNDWHNFAVEFDQRHNRLKIYVDRVLKAAVDLTTLVLPAIACPADITTTAAPGQTSALVTFNVSARGNNGTDTGVVCNPASSSAFPLGTTTVNCTAMDAFGNQSSCSFQVTVSSALPTIATLSPVTATAGGTDFTLTVNGSNFAGDSIVQWSGAARSTTFVSPNQLTATISAADITLAGQNINTALITVQNTDGSVSSPQAFTIVNPDVGTVQSQVATGGQTATASAPPTASDQGGVTASLDNTSGSQPVTVTAATYTSNPGSGTTFDVGSSYVDLKVSGATANSSMTSCFYYPATVTGNAEAHLTLLYYTGAAGWAPVLSSGGVAPAKNTTDNVAGITSGGRFTVVFDSTSTPPITQLTGTPFALVVDTTPPTIACPANITVPADPGQCSAAVNFQVTASDNSGTVTVASTPPSGSVFLKGITTVTCNATDPSGNTSTCSFTVMVNDTEPPKITCPANITLPCSVNLLVPVTFSVTASDNCDPSPKVVCTPASGSGFPVGPTTVTGNATDSSGNTSTCSFSVTRAPLGFSGFLAPIGGADSTGGSFASPLRTFKMGSTVPVKFTATCGGSAVVTGVQTLEVIKYTNATTDGAPIDATPQDSATTGDQFRLSSGQWIFNLDTKGTGMSTGIWLLRATLSDGSLHAAWIQLK